MPFTFNDGERPHYGMGRKKHGHQGHQAKRLTVLPQYGGSVTHKGHSEGPAKRLTLLPGQRVFF